MTPEEGEEARRLLRYLAQKVRRYADASIKTEQKGILAAKFYMFGAMQEAEDFLYTNPVQEGEVATEAFELPSEEEELNELKRAIGEPVGEGRDQNAHLDAVASDALRIVRREQEEIARYDAAAEAEISRIRMRYTFMVNKHVARAAAAEEIAKECARQAAFPGKSRSRHVGNGTYGLRQRPEKVSIVDDKAFITWAHVGAPHVIRTETKEKVLVQDVKPLILAMRTQPGNNLPPGILYEPAHDEAYAKVEGD